MSNQLKQLEPIRRQAAKIKGYIFHLQQLNGHSRDQSHAIRQCQIAFNRIITVDIKKIRQAYGDDNYMVMEDIDCFRNVSEFSFRPDVIINEIEKALKKLHKLAVEISEASNEDIVLAISDLRSCEFGELKYSFKNV